LKKILFIVLFLILSLGTVVYANDISQSEKSIMPVLIVNNSFLEPPANTIAKSKAELPSILISHITKSLDTRYNIKRLENTFNILDVASTEKIDLLEMFKEPDYSSIILIEILPAHVHTYSQFYSIHIKILDIKTGKYLYNGKLWSFRMMPQSALNEMGVDLEKILKNIFTHRENI